MPELKMPLKRESDGTVRIRRLDDGRIVVTVSEVGRPETCIEMSAFNAWRAFGLLALMLEARLPKALAKAIKL